MNGLWGSYAERWKNWLVDIQRQKFGKGRKKPDEIQNQVEQDYPLRPLYDVNLEIFSKFNIPN